MLLNKIKYVLISKLLSCFIADVQTKFGMFTTFTLDEVDDYTTEKAQAVAEAWIQDSSFELCDWKLIV